MRKTHELVQDNQPLATTSLYSPPINNSMVLIHMRTLIVLSLLSTSVYADRWHHEHENVTNITNVYEVTEVSENVTEITENSYNTTEQANGTALAIASSQINFDFATKDWQAGIGAGHFDGSNAVSFGIGKRFKNVLLNGTIGRESNKSGYGVGAVIRF